MPEPATNVDDSALDSTLVSLPQGSWPLERLICVRWKRKGKVDFLTLDIPPLVTMFLQTSQEEINLALTHSLVPSNQCILSARGLDLALAGKNG